MLSPVSVVGLLHEVNAEPSRLHSKVLPSSLELKANVALVEFDATGGAEVIVVSGAIVSTVHE